MAEIVLDKVSVTYGLGLRSMGPRPAVPFEAEVGGALQTGPFGGKVMALDEISLVIGQGMRVGLIGQNGAGKTTLLKLMSGIVSPSYGGVRIEGRVTSLISPYVGLDLSATGRENAVLRAMLNGVSRRHALAQLPDIIEFSGLGAYIDVPLRAYSSGMVARLVFAVSTAFAPEIVLIDEAIVAGDEGFQRKAASRVQRFVSGSGILVIAAHAPTLLRQMCSHLVWVHGGKLVRFGPIDEIEELYVASNADVDETGRPLSERR